jgi:hypothetical protein
LGLAVIRYYLGGEDVDWSYTYKSAGDPDWHQTTDDQFGTGTLTDTETTGSDSVQLAGGGGGGIPSVVNTTQGGSINEAAGAFTVNLPASSSSYLAVVAAMNGSASVTPPANWTLLEDRPDGANGDSDWNQFFVYYAQDSNSPGTSWDWNTNQSTEDAISVIIYGFDQEIVIDGEAYNDNSSFVAPSVTTTEPALIVRALTVNTFDPGGGTMNYPAGAPDDRVTLSTDSGNCCGDSATVALATSEQASPGATGTATFSLSGTDTYVPIAGTIAIASSNSGASTGTIMSPAIDFDNVLGQDSWNQVSWSEDETNGLIDMQVYYTDSTTCDTVVPNGDLSGNESGFASSPIDISGLNTTTYNEVCLRATLNESGGTPFLQDWTVTWTTANTPPSAPASLAQTKTDDTNIPADSWINETDVKFSATVTDPDSDNVRLCVEVKDLATLFSDSEDDCSTLVASGNTASVTIDVGAISGDDEYHWQARAKDDSEEYSSWVAFGGGVTKDFGIDLTAPTGGNVYDGTTTGVDVTFNDGSLDELSANWDGFNFDISGATTNPYEYSIGTTQGGTEVVGWTSLTGEDLEETAASLTLQTSEIYYFNVRVTDNAGNQSVVSSDGQFVLPTLSFTATPTSITFDNLNASNSPIPYTDSSKFTTLTTSTNAYGGYAVRASATDVLKTANALFDIPWFSGDGGASYATPQAWSGTGFGYTSNDNSIQGAGDLFGGGTLYAPFSTSSPGDVVADHTNNVTGTPITDEEFTINYRVTTSPNQAAGKYDSTIIYRVTATY